MSAPDPIAFAGTERFEVRRRIGAGAMGIVYEAFDREREMAVALKVMRRTVPESVLRFKQEVRALAGIAHPNLIALHELHAEDGTWFITMELLEDCVDLATYVGRAPADEHRLRASLAQLAQGIAALHAAGRLHRDIKPSNVLVTGEPRVVLLDFGVVAEIGRPDEALLGTPAYAAPEQAHGQAAPASDWYALAVVLYELLTGGLPFQGSGRAIMFDKERYDPQPVLVRNPDAPLDLAALCDALLRRDPEARPTGRDVLRRLDVAQRRSVTPVPIDRESLLLGREDALAVLRGGFADAERGHGTVIHVRGTSGIGKSTLVRSFLRELERETNAVVLAGRCYPQESVPYKAVDSLVDALASFLDGLPATEADAVLPRDILLLAQVFPVLASAEAVVRARRRRGVQLEPHELRRRAFAALRELVARIAEQRSVVIFVDDVQWGDLDSAPILDVLMMPPDPPAVVLVLAYRAEDEQRAPLLRALRQRRERLGAAMRAVDLTLEPLPEREARALAVALTGEHARSAEIAAESGGVPFLVHALALVANGGAPSVASAVASRLDDLTRSERSVIELTAHAAKPIAREVLASASGSSRSQLERDLARLVAAQLLRLTPGDGEDARFECYHDRIREAVTATLSDGRRRDLHALLAGSLSQAPVLDLEALVVHYEGAGDRERAGGYALAAAEQADRALAFDRAAQLYRVALRLATLDAARTREVRTALGDALANAGQGADAAEIYLAAAQDAPAANALELRRRAASQFLRTGRIDSGLRVLDQVLAEVGGRLPRSPRRAFASLVWHRARLRIRGLGYKRRDATRVAPYELARVDVLSTAATDLGMVDLIVGADFGTRQALRALDVGEPMRVARALTNEAIFLAAQGKPLVRRTEAVLARAQALIGELEDPELPLWLAMARGIVEYQHGRFRRAAAYGEECVRRLREDCTGVLWQVGGVEVHVMWALFYLGELRELSKRVDIAVEQARQRGNRFDAANFGTGLPALAWAVADRTAQGRIEVEHVMAEWSPRGFHLQHYYALLALASFELYDGDATAAHARIEALWPMLVDSRLLICPSVAIEGHHLRGRVAIATGRDLAPDLQAVARHRGNPWADAMAALLRAGATADRDEAAGALAAAIEACVQADLAMFAAAARHRLGELRGGAEGAGLIERSRRELADQAVRAPAKLARLLVPIRAEVRHDP